AITGAMISTIQARAFATASSVSPEKIEACAAGAESSAPSAAARRAGERRVLRSGHKGLVVMRKYLCYPDRIAGRSITRRDAEPDLVERGCAGGLAEIEPVPLVAEAHADRGCGVPADAEADAVSELVEAARVLPRTADVAPPRIPIARAHRRAVRDV